MSLNDLPLKFYNVGLSYKKADVNVRGVFSITKEDQVSLLKEAKMDAKVFLSFPLVIEQK